jgi:hypothetical protein
MGFVKPLFSRGIRHPIHSVPFGYAAYVNQVFALLHIRRDHLDYYLARCLLAYHTQPAAAAAATPPPRAA